VVAALQARAKPGTKYALVAPDQARYTREFAFATVKADGHELSVLLDATGTGGTVRSRPRAAPKAEEPAATFAIGGRPAGGPGGRGMPKGGERGGPKGGDRAAPRGSDGLKLDHPLHERVQASVPAVLEKTGFPAGEVTVTSVPDLSFLMDAGGTVWRVTYNAQTGSVAGRATDEPVSENTLSPRRFLTRLHTTHGYPGEWGARWAMAGVVDAMAAVMVFWGLTGLLMWWQIRATRWVGLAVLVVSAAAAAWVGVGMHELLAAAPVGR
jgi:hypothetical protein